MNLFASKIIGWIFLIIGVFLIFWSVYNSYNIFMGSKPVPNIFKIESKEPCPTLQCPQDSQIKQGQQLQDLQTQVQKIVEGQFQEQIKKIIPPEFISKILNLASWSILVMILIFAGSNLASLGVKLIKS